MYLAIDYGKKRIGLAIGSLLPRGIGTIQNPGSFDQIAEKISAICKNYEVEGIVIGLPIKKSGDASELAAEINQLAKILEKKCHLRVNFEEEAYTSTEAEQELIKRGVDIKKEKEKIDELAAVLILEQFLAKIN